jgi:hypothetical protein
MTTMTGFELSKIASERLGRTIRPQMVYNYMKKGKIATVDGRVTVEAAAEFIRQQSGVTNVNREARLQDLGSAIDELLEG